ncbi:hypothetical protein CISIN_1g043749mg, partial [Citrus sinensis]
MSPSLGNQILGTKSLVKVPISCPCIDGIKRSESTTNNVWPADTIDSILNEFGGLVSAEQINSTNGSNYPTSLMIMLSCTCFNNGNNGVTSVYKSKFWVMMAELVATNGLSQSVVDPIDILAIPIL